MQDNFVHHRLEWEKAQGPCPWAVLLALGASMRVVRRSIPEDRLMKTNSCAA